MAVYQQRTWRTMALRFPLYIQERKPLRLLLLLPKTWLFSCSLFVPRLVCVAVMCLDCTQVDRMSTIIFMVICHKNVMLYNPKHKPCQLCWEPFSFSYWRCGLRWSSLVCMGTISDSHFCISPQCYWESLSSLLWRFNANANHYHFHSYLGTGGGEFCSSARGGSTQIQKRVKLGHSNSSKLSLFIKKLVLTNQDCVICTVNAQNLHCKSVVD